MKNIGILGSTGSIGTQALEVIRENKGYKVVSITGNNNVDLLEKQAREFKPSMVGVYNEHKAKDLKERLKDTDIKVVSGIDGLISCAVLPSIDIVLTAVVGMIGILPTIEAIKAKKDIALANKETLVTAGHLIMPLVEENKVKLLPVDSEHSAIFQCLQGNNHKEVSKLLITASGGPFFGKTTMDLEKVTIKDALNHPNWSMGKKITVDSSTLVNKGLEVLEAHWLFNMPLDDIEVVVQRESIIHSMVEFKDGGVIAQLGYPDMKLPISYALYYPNRKQITGARLDFKAISKISINQVDNKTFKGIDLAVKAGKNKGSMATVFNSSNEWAVRKFLLQKIKFLDIYRYIELAMESHKEVLNPSIEKILEIERETYNLLERVLNK